MVAEQAEAGGLTGQQIKAVFSEAAEIAAMHACVTSPRGDYFRLKLLQAMEVPLDDGTIEQLRIKAELHEHHRHVHLMIDLGLVKVDEVDGQERYARTDEGEHAINLVRNLERRVGRDEAVAIYGASLGTNSIRLFLKVYGDQREADWKNLTITFTPAEIGRMSLFLPRVIEGVSAIDKLNQAGLLAYRDDDHIHMNPSLARGFYQYLRELNSVVAPGGPGRNQ